MAKRKPPKPTYRLTYLRQWREFRGLSLAEASAEIGLTHASLSRIERGLQPYNQAHIERLAKLYDTDEVSLLTRDPRDPEGIWKLWEQARPSQRERIVSYARGVVEPNTD